MHSRFFRLLVLFFAFSLPFSVSPCLRGGLQQVHAAEVRVLTLDQAVAIAMEQNRDIRQAREYARQVSGRYVEERAAALPQVTVTGSVSRDRDESMAAMRVPTAPQNHLKAEVGFTQAVFTWGQVGAAIRAAKAGLLTAEDQLRLSRQGAILDVTTAFQDVLLARELHTISRHNLEQKLRHLDESERRFAVGVATDYDVLAARVAADNARPEVIRAENMVRQARDRFRFHLALEEEVDADGSLECIIESHPTFEEAFASARQRRPELADLRHRLAAAQELVAVANAGDKPRLDLRGGYGWKELEVNGDQSDGPAWNLGLHLSFPIFDGLRTRGKVAQAESDVRNRQIDEARLLDSIALDCRDGVNAVKEAEEIVRALTETVGQAARLLEMAEKGYELGVKIRLEVEDAELNLRQARGNLARARRDYLVARTNLERIMGVLGE